MATYAIGDIQGCLKPLEKLLDKIQFDPTQDHLWFTGDIVNRGPSSLETLRFIKNLGPHQTMVLGNHDLHLLAVAYGQHQGWAEDTLLPILEAPDREELIDWLLKQPLLHHDADLGYTMIHAGLAYNWDLEKTLRLAKEVETVLQSPDRIEFFKHMYGNEPIHWSDELHGWDRLRCITNYLTRARFCHRDGSLELKSKGKQTESEHLIPWFQVSNRLTANDKIIFGHWAALGGVTHTPNAYALDTGCVWGFSLTAMRLEDKKRFFTDCKDKIRGFLKGIDTTIERDGDRT